MNSHFFLICFGVLGSYAALRTARPAWLRLLLAFLLIRCTVKIALDEIFPEPVLVAQPQPQSQQQQTSGPKISLSRVHDFIAAQLISLEDDRCIMAHLADTPLGPVAYVLQAHQFLRAYSQAQSASAAGGGTNLGTISQAVDTTFGPGSDENADPTLCDKFVQWAQDHAQTQIQNAVQGQRENDDQ